MMRALEQVLLLCDVVDSTAWTERLGDERSAELWRLHDSTARRLLETWHGREVDKTDGLFALFIRTEDALGYAGAYHLALANLTPPLRARVAIHCAAVLLRETPSHDVARGAKPLEVDGVGKPVVARIGALALPGQTLLSDAAATRLTAGPPVAPLGHWRFKGVSDPVALFELTGDTRGPPPDSDKAWRVTRSGEYWLPTRDVPRNLPSERDSFVGRRPALSELASMFGAGVRLVTISGVGGCGKTRLALRHGWDALGGHAGGVWFCDLSQATTFDGVVHAVAQGIQLPLAAGDPVQQIGDAISSRGHALVILDNFEQVAAHAEAVLDAWMSRAASASFLVTSREVLGVAGESVLTLPPLPEEEAAELFFQRARSAVGDFAAEPSESEAVAELVRLLDGLPLAIELAASRTRVMNARTMLSRMGERFKLLAAPGKRKDRQATLRATLDWSWDLMNPAERSAFAQMSVFEGGFFLRAAEGVIDLAALGESPWVIDVVQSLVQKSLVRTSERHRFDLLRSVHDYARLALCEEGRIDANRRHARYFAALDERTAIAGRCADADNLVAACRHATADGCASDAVGALRNAWAALRLTGPFNVASGLAETVLAMPGLDADQHAQATLVAASALDAIGRSREAAALLEATRPQLAAGSPSLPRFLCVTGEIASNLGQFDAAARHLSEAHSMAADFNDAETQCRALNALGWIAYWRGSFVESKGHYQQALDIAQGLADLRWQGGLLGNLGALEHTRGRHDEARSCYERSLALAIEVGDRRWEANARCNLGLLHCESGNDDDALVHLEAALTMARHMGHRKLEGTVLCNLGHVHESRGETGPALANYEHAVQIAHLSGDPRAEGVYRAHWGLLLARSGSASEARSCLAAGASLLDNVAHASDLALLLCKQSLAESVLGDASAARLAFDRAEALAGRVAPDQGSELAKALSAARVARDIAKAG